MYPNTGFGAGAHQRWQIWQERKEGQETSALNNFMEQFWWLEWETEGKGRCRLFSRWWVVMGSEFRWWVCKNAVVCSSFKVGLKWFLVRQLTIQWLECSYQDNMAEGWLGNQNNNPGGKESCRWRGGWRKSGLPKVWEAPSQHLECWLPISFVL